jgi:hypothetical protein
VAGVFVLRKRDAGESRFRAPWHPLLPTAFILLSLWILGYLLVVQPAESLMGLLILGAGAGMYFISGRKA